MPMDVVDKETGEVLSVPRFRKAHERFPVNKIFYKSSRTKASFAEECDINSIMAKYQKYGVIDAVQKTNGQFGDFANVDDYHSAMNAVVDAQERFEMLPAKLRKRFGNDPAELLAFLADPENVEEAVKLGLILPEQKKAAADAAAVVSPDEGDSVIRGSDPEDRKKAAQAAS